MHNQLTYPNRYLFYDIESTSAIARSTQIVQIALIETDSHLNVLMDENGKERTHMFYVKMRPDMIADPGAFLVHKVNPDWVGHYLTSSNGLPNQPISDTEFANMPDKPDGLVYTEREANIIIQQIMTRVSNTCIAGYNSDRFDDEVIRHNFYRNMLDPYAHEWANYNHRTDVFKAVQLMRMYAEKSLEWPMGDDDKVSLKLEKLSAANGLVHEKAHDALSDIYATIHLAKLIKDRKPTIWEKFKQLSDKRHVDRLLSSGEVVALTQTFISKDRYGTTLALPVAKDPSNKNKHYLIDLTGDMSPLTDMTTEELREFLFTPKSKRKQPFSEIDFNIRSVSINKSPLVNIPPTKNAEESKNEALSRICKRIGVNESLVFRNIEFVRQNITEISRKVSAVFSEQKEFEPLPTYSALYDGFFDNSEKSSREFLLSISDDSNRVIDSVDAFEFASKQANNKDKHLLLTIISKWGHITNPWNERESLSPTDANELIIYERFVRDNLSGKGEGIGLDRFKDILSELKANQDERPLSDFEKHIINGLSKEVSYVTERYASLKRLMTPQFISYANKDREVNSLKYEAFSTLFEKVISVESDPEQSAECNL